VKTASKRLIPAWLTSVPFCCLGAGFLGNFYSAPYELALASLTFNIGAVLFLYLTLPMLKARARAKPFDAGIAFALLAAIAAFGWILFGMAAQFPGLFEAGIYHLEGAEWISLVAGFLLSLPVSAFIAAPFKDGGIGETRLGRLVDENLGGLILAFSFFPIYLFLASIFNQPAFDADDIFFDADSRLWHWRFATENYHDYYWRPVHPFVLIIVRPLVWLVSLPLKGDALYAAFALTALAGALCVFIVRYLVKRTIGNSSYALLIAALFGASAAHLAFASLIETYIFLAAVALVFLLLLVTDKPLSMQVVAGLAAFGITISNFGQTVIAHWAIKRDVRKLVLYGLIVAALVVPLTLLNNVVYPEAHPYFFDLKSYEGEGHNQFPMTLQRANLLARVMFLHSFVAPDPLVRQEEDIPFLKVWMFRASIKKDPMLIARYESDLGRALVTAWIVLMTLGAALFLKNIRRQDNRLPLTFVLILLFNFALHLRYGKDVFLYSANWTYAVVLFLALAWGELAAKRWFQIALLVFIALMLANNSRLFQAMLNASALWIK
jgi:hypothetical protein